jgi:hypothetical protein
MDPTGISNRESPEQEQKERKEFGRGPDAARDRAGHIITEAPAERVEREQDEHVQAPNEDSPRGRRIRQSR